MDSNLIAGVLFVCLKLFLCGIVYQKVNLIKLISNVSWAIKKTDLIRSSFLSESKFFDGGFTETTVGNAIVVFRKFMDLEPYATTANLTVSKGLLTSNGNTDRDSNDLRYSHTVNVSGNSQI